MKTKETQGEMHLRHKLELGREIDHLRSEIQKAKEKEIRGDRMIVDLENQKCVLKSDLSKAKELNGELVKAVKEMKAQIQSLGYYPECLSHELEALIKKSEI